MSDCDEMTSRPVLHRPRHTDPSLEQANDSAPLNLAEGEVGTNSWTYDTPSSASTSFSLDREHHRMWRWCRPGSMLPSNGSKSGAVANFCSATLGAGVLALPLAFSKTGIVPGLLLLLLAALSTVLSIDVLIQSCHRFNLPTYETLTAELCGKRAGRLVEGCILIFCFGTAVAYVVAVGDILQQGVIGVFSDSLPPVVNREFVMVFFWLLVMLPLSLYERMDSLRFASLFGIASIVFLVLATVIHSVRDLISGDVGSHVHGIDREHEDKEPVNSLHIWAGSFWDIMRACPIFMFAFSTQVNCPAIFEELNPSSDLMGSALNSLSASTKAAEQRLKAMRAVTRYGVGIALVCYVFMGVFGYADFREHTQDNVLKNFCIHDTRDPLMIVAFVCVAFAVVMAFPLLIFPARVTLEGMLNRSDCCNRCCPVTSKAYGEEISEAGDPALQLGEPLILHSETQSNVRTDSPGDNSFPLPFTTRPDNSRLRHVSLTIAISSLALLVALVVPDISILFGFMGGTASSIIGFIMPGLFALKLTKDPCNETVGGVANRRHSNDEDVLGSDTEIPADFTRQQTAAPRRRLQAWALILCGVAIGILSTGVTIYSVFKNESNPGTCSDDAFPL